MNESLRTPGVSVVEEPLFTIDHNRMIEVLDRLLSARQNNEFPYNLETTRVPQDERHMPSSLEVGSTDHAMFLFTVCYYMRGGIKSNDAFYRLGGMYDRIPELFKAEIAKNTDPEIIARELKKSGLGFQEVVSQHWKINAGRMDEKWDGDPREIFVGINTYEEAIARIKNYRNKEGFMGFQEKMVSMITYYLMATGLIDYFDFPLPVDLHVLRVSIANELIKFDNPEGRNLYSQELLAALRKAYLDYAVKHEINMIDLCNAVWMLSESICGKQPGNITLEPEGRKNRNGRKTLLVPLPIIMDSMKQREAYEGSCGQCPVELTCKWNVPGKIYYVQGELQTRGVRQKYPPPHKALQLF